MEHKLKNNQKIETGKWGEGIALKFLLGKGYQMVERNFRSTDGEIDLIVMKGSDLVFVEVKTRRTRDFGSPEEAVDDEKLEHLEGAAGWYLQQHPEFEDNWHLDVISVISASGSNAPEIEWFENVIAS